jgi:predicted AAA+ superfamily ATPase
MQRYLENQIIHDALSANKMAFLYGPRQVGKTTLAKNILAGEKQIENYYNWDDENFKKIWSSRPDTILTQSMYPNPIVVLDEIHKDLRWKNKLKGLYDIHQQRARILVTGSARLDYFKRSGDSLLGRFLPYRIHPLTLGETPRSKPPPKKDWLENLSKNFALEDLLSLGGFPEPLLGGSEGKAKRWGRLQRERLIFEDLRDLSATRNIKTIDFLATLLTARVGSQLSFKSLEEDLKCSHTALKDWLLLLETIYFSYHIRPYSKNIKRSLIKEPKLYLYNWALVEDEAARYENLIAGHLLKSCHYWTDLAFGEFELFYLRDKDKREVDFFVTKDQKPYLLLEVKSNSHDISPSTHHFYNMTKPPFAFQVVRNKKKVRSPFQGLKSPIRIVSAEEFLSALA